MNCPECGSPCEYDEVDIGVGVQRGPAACSECGWSESFASGEVDDEDENEDDENETFGDDDDDWGDDEEDDTTEDEDDNDNA